MTAQRKAPQLPARGNPSLAEDATKVRVAKEEIDTITPIKKSAMPEGLLNPLTLEEIADLFAYLKQPPELKQGPEAKSREPTLRR